MNSNDVEWRKLCGLVIHLTISKEAIFANLITFDVYAVDYLSLNPV